MLDRVRLAVVLALGASCLPSLPSGHDGGAGGGGGRGAAGGGGAGTGAGAAGGGGGAGASAGTSGAGGTGGADGGQPTTPAWGAPAIVDSGQSPRVAMGGSRATLVWLALGTDWVVRARTHTDGAGSWDPAVDLQLSTGASLPGAAPKVAMNAHGVTMVTWKQMGNGDEDAAFSFRLPTAAGNGWPSGPLVSTDLSFGSGGTADPVVAIGANDDGMWLLGSSGYIRAVSFLGDGTSGMGGTVSQVGPAVSCPAVSVNASGHAMGAWIETPSGGSAGVTAWYSSADQSSQARTSAPLATAAPGALGCPRVALDDLGRAIAVWSVASGGGSSLAYDTYDPGSGWGAQAKTIDSAGAAAYSPDVALSPTGEGFLFWEQATTTSASATRDVRAVHLQLGRGLDAGGGQPVGATAPATTARLVVTGAGSALAIWAQGGRIWSNTFAAAPSGGWSSSAAPIDTARNQYASQNPDLATDGAGRALAAWESTSGGVPDVVIARFE